MNMPLILWPMFLIVVPFLWQLPQSLPAERLVPPLVACIEAEGWKVEFVSLPPDVYVLGDRVHSIVSVNENLDTAGRVGSLLYQLAYNHRPSHLSQTDQDVWAESVAQRTLLRVGLPTDDSVAYLQRFPRAEFIAVAERNTIDAESASIQACIVMGPARGK